MHHNPATHSRTFPLHAHAQHMRHPSCSEAWKLRCVELLAADWLLQPQQARVLLQLFDAALGRSEQAHAAVVLHARLVQPIKGLAEVFSLLAAPQRQSVMDM